jgi:hypothetical protein
MNGQLVHVAHPLARGKRYVLSGFTYINRSAAPRP